MTAKVSYDQGTVYQNRKFHYTRDRGYEPEPIVRDNAMPVRPSRRQEKGEAASFSQTACSPCTLFDNVSVWRHPVVRVGELLYVLFLWIKPVI